RLGHFAFTKLPELGIVDYIPGLAISANARQAVRVFESAAKRPGYVFAFLSALQSLDQATSDELPSLFSSSDRPLGMICVDRNSMNDGGTKVSEWLHQLSPDMVIFDESFVENSVPFGAFAATKQLYRHWNKRGMSTFHSTTFQPNTISTLHFMQCLQR